MKKRELPYGAFKLALALVPDILQIYAECDLSPTELFILAHIHHSGKEYQGKMIFLKEELRELLMDSFRLSPPQVTKDIMELRTKAWLEEIVVPPDDREALFGIREGRRTAYQLTQKGIDKISEFVEKINLLFARLTKKIPTAVFIPFTIALESLIKKAVK